MALLDPQLIVERCPHCNVDQPNLNRLYSFDTTNHRGTNGRMWGIYKCSRCGGIVTASAISTGQQVIQIFPDLTTVDENIPTKAKSFLQQAINSLHSPSGAIMLSASSVDAMLKEKGYKNGNLHKRINKAAEDHLITEEMSKWAHQVRLDANDQRHADEEAELPNEDDAKKTIDFTLALAEFLFVLPSRIEKGLEETEPKEGSEKEEESDIDSIGEVVSR
jgi:hypothetical protein